MRSSPITEGGERKPKFSLCITLVMVMVMLMVMLMLMAVMMALMVLLMVMVILRNGTCRKNSSQHLRDQSLETGHSRQGLEMSAHWKESVKVRECELVKV